MAILEILTYPDPRLREKAQQITNIDEKLQTIIDNMLETMYHANGIGLAATQVNIQLQLMVIDVSEKSDSPLVFINPQVIEKRGIEEMDEGCLSFPGVYAKVKRANEIKVSALDRHGKTFEVDTGDLLAVCIQHELDHLEGKLFVDYLSPLKRQRIKSKLEKENRRSR
ncbi:MAG: peptide deformylase [Pseudomonadota bacterium]